MGNGFAFVARQKHFQVGSSDSYADLILYNIKLHTYIVVELKATPFKPKYAEQLNFYINVVDDQMRGWECELYRDTQAFETTSLIIGMIFDKYYEMILLEKK